MNRVLVALGGLWLAPAALFGQATSADTTFFAVQVDFDRSIFVLREPFQLRSPWLGKPRQSPEATVAEWDRRVAARLEADRVDRSSNQLLAQLYGRMAFATADTTGQGTERRGLLGIDQRYADLSIDAQARFEIRTDRLKNLKCTTAEALRPDSGCRATFKAPRLDTEFSALAGGVLGQRVHINVDWDTQRELDATNTIQVFYQGLDDEIQEHWTTQHLRAARSNESFVERRVVEREALGFDCRLEQEEGRVGGQLRVKPGERISRIAG